MPAIFPHYLRRRGGRSEGSEWGYGQKGGLEYINDLVFEDAQLKHRIFSLTQWNLRREVITSDSEWEESPKNDKKS